MTFITSVPTSRVSNPLVRQRLLSQLQSDQRELFRLQTAISTGRRIVLPSEDPSASLRAISLQRLLERKEQVQTNTATNQSFLTATETALGDVTSLVNEVRSVALSVTGDQATDTERAEALAAVERTIQQLVNTANRTFRGRYLFGGSDTASAPFSIDGNFVNYHGNEKAISSFADIGLLVESNVNGDEVFGAISSQVTGSVDLDPVLTRNTRIEDLRGGQGISEGSISVAVGSDVSIIDFSGIATIGDLADLIETNAPSGADLSVTVTSKGISIAADAGVLTIKEVGGGTVATELGILEEIGGVGQPIVGDDLDPLLRLTTSVDDIIGSRAFAQIDSPGNNNAIVITANRRGSEYNGLAINFVDDAGVVAGNEFAVYDPDAKTLEVHIDAGNTTAQNVVDALDSDPAFGADFSTSLDPREAKLSLTAGTGTFDVNSTATTFDGGGEEFDKDSGIRITNGGQTFDLAFSSAETIEDALNAINGLNAVGASVVATLNADGTGIDVRSTLSGADFSIGENGGSTASQLGIRSITRDTNLDVLNHGQGVGTRDGTDFTIRRADGVELEIDLSAARTVGDVLDAVNNHVANQDGANRVVAQLNTFGNGIEFVSDNASNAATFEIVRAAHSPAAVDLGIVPSSQNNSNPAENIDPATVQLSLTSANTDLLITAASPGPQFNNVDVIFADDGSVTGDDATVTFDALAGTLTVFIDSTVGTGTTADTIRQRINADGNFQAALDLSNDPTNDGSGVVTDLSNVGTTAGGTARIAGDDPNPGEVRGIFTGLVNLQEALGSGDINEISRAVELLDEGLTDVNFSRAEVGARQKSLESLQSRLELEEIELRGALSEDIDVDIAEAISELTARQISLEASLQLTGLVSQLTLLDFL